MKNRRIAGIAATALLAGTLAGCAGTGGSAAGDENCTPEYEFDTISDGTLTVANVDLPPFTQSGEGGLEGVEGALMTKFAEESCVDLQIDVLTAAASIPAIQSGRADIGTGAFYRTAERAEVVEVTEPIYLDQMALMSTDGYVSVDDLEGKNVGTVDGYLWVEDLRGLLGDDMKVYNTAQNLYEDLKNGRIDIAVDSFGSGMYNLEDTDFQVEVVEPDDRVAASLEAAQIMFPIAPDNSSLTEAMDEFITQLRESGELGEILEENGLDASAADVGEARLIG
ncbi:ABC transporter substrate-binding protein [Leucobacter sp. GX24907]